MHLGGNENGRICGAVKLHHCQNILNNASDFIVVVGKNATGIFQLEKRLTAINTNMWVASSGAEVELT